MRSEWDRMHEHQVVRDVRDLHESMKRDAARQSAAIAADNARRSNHSPSLDTWTNGSSSTAQVNDDDGLFGKAGSRVINWGESLSQRLWNGFINPKAILAYICLLGLVLFGTYNSFGSDTSLNVAVIGALGYFVVPFILRVAIELLSLGLGVLIRSIPVIFVITILIVVLATFGSA